MTSAKVVPTHNDNGLEAVGEGKHSTHASEDMLLQGLMVLCKLYDRTASAAKLTAGLPLVDGCLTPNLLQRAAARADLDIRVSRKKVSAIPPSLLPVLMRLADGAIVVLTRMSDKECSIVYPEMETREEVVPIEVLEARYNGKAASDQESFVVFAAPLMRRDNRSEGFAADPKRHWFWGEIALHKRDFMEVAFAAAIANLLAIASSLFAMQVYDRVVPNLAFATLWVLFLGVALAIAIEAMIRIVRSHLMDTVGRRIDVNLSSRLFERALGMRLEVRPKSTGAFTNQVREFDAIREFFTSTTIGTLSDLPFAILFVIVIWMIGGPVAWVLVAAIPCIVLPGLLAQPSLSRLSRLHLREGSIRSGLLIEGMSGIETVKATQAEGRFQRLWEDYTLLLSKNGQQMRMLSSVLTYSATAVQQGAYATVIVVGVYQIAEGKMTVGALLACAILSSRTIAPLTQLAGIFSRWQHMRVALTGLNAIMTSPVDRPRERTFVHRSHLGGDYKLENVVFRYEEEGAPVLDAEALNFKAGARVALLGSNGSGKSTLLKLLSGIYQPTQGQLLIDGVDIRQIDPADVRRSVAYLPQDVTLFHGTLRDNLTLGLQNGYDDDQLLESLDFVGALSLVRNHPLGLDREISEGGHGVSGGQRQSIGLARIWLRDPQIVLLDEPTSAMDQALEVNVIGNMKPWMAERTLVVATHRHLVLSLVERATVLNGGRLVADGPVDEVIASLTPGAKLPARVAQKAGIRAQFKHDNLSW